MSDEEVLGDFFSKKDKSKKPKKKKKTKTETVITQSESQTVQVDEWKDFEEQKEKDFSNLKISDYQAGEEIEKEEQEGTPQNVSEGGEIADGEEGDPAVWKPVANGSSANAAPPKPAPVDTPGSHNVVGGKYIPPSMKRATMAAAASSQPTRRRGAPPDIKSQAAFPTLAAAKQDSDSKTPDDFEMVKKGTRTNDARRDENGPSLQIGNRYTGLRS